MKCRRLLLFLVMLISLVSVPVYGDESLSMGDGMASVTLPDEWEFYYCDGQGAYASTGDIDEGLDESVYWNLLPYENDPNVLLTARKAYTHRGETTPVTIQVVYSDNYSLDELDGPIDPVIDPVYTAMNVLPYFGVDGKNKKPYEAVWQTYQVAEIDQIENDDGGSCYLRVYSTEVGMNSVSFIVTGYDQPFTKAQKKEFNSIVDSFQDDGYYNQVAGAPGQNGGWVGLESDDETNVLITLLPIFLIVIGIVLKLTKGNRINSDTVKKTVQSPVGQDRGIGQGPTEDPPEIKLSGEQPSATEDTTASQQRQTYGSVRVKRQAKDSGQSYVTSLQTLYESGLLTKKELNDMLEKHRKRS